MTREKIKLSILWGLTKLLEKFELDEKQKAKVQSRIDHIEFVTDFAINKHRAPTDYEFSEYLASLKKDI